MFSPPSAVPMLFRRVLLLLAIACAALPAASQTPSPCDTVLVRAETAFFDGAFGETIRLLTPCAAPDAPRPPSTAMYRLLSMAFMNDGDAGGARRTISDLLIQHPAYEADPVQDPPAYVVLVSAIREQLQAQGRLPAMRVEPSPRRGRLGAFIGATLGLAVIGVAAYLVGEPLL